MIAQLQVEGEQLIVLKDMFVGSGARLLVDHCARHRLDIGILLTLAQEQFPDSQQREKYFWKNAAQLIGF